MIWEIFRNIQYDVYYKAIFVVFSVILILSIFLETKGIPNEKIQMLAITAVLYSFVAWFTNDVIRLWQGQLNELRARIDIDYMGNLKKVTVLNAGLFFVFLVVFLYIFWVY